MARLLTGDDKFHDSSDDDSYRSYLTNRQEPAHDYRFGRSPVKRDILMRRALRRVNGFLKTMIKAIANSKLRRIERELEFRGIRPDARSDNQVARKSGPIER